MKKITLLFFLGLMHLGFSQNIVLNGEFSSGLESWSSFIADFAGVAATVNATNNEASITNITGAGGQVWHVQLNQLLTAGQIASLVVGESYKISFDARSNANGRQLRLFFGQDGDPFTSLIIEDYELTTTMEAYEATVTVGQTFGAMKLGFEMGLSNNDVFIDNVVLELNVVDPGTCTDGIQNGEETGVDCGGSVCEPCAAPGNLTELIGNGSFETGDFTDWEVSGTGITVVNTNPSEGNFAANLNNIVLASSSSIKSANRGIGIVNPGDELTIKFDIRGTAAAGGLLFVQLFSEFAGGGASNQFVGGGAPFFPNADPEIWTSYEYTLNAEANVAGGVSLLFNAVTGGAEGSVSNYFIDNVSMVNNDESLSVNDVLSNLKVKVFPNPTNANWTLTSANNQNLTSVKVFDILGKQVISINPDNTEAVIDASNLRDGLYLAKISTVNGSQTVKLIKN